MLGPGKCCRFSVRVFSEDEEPIGLLDDFGTAISFALAVASVVVGSFLYDVLQSRRRRPRLDFYTTQSKERLGFVIRSKNKTLKEARARCNLIEYDWESGDGVKARRKDILVGDDQSVIYPFQHNAVWIDSKDFSHKLDGTPYTPVPTQAGVRGGVLVTLVEVTTGETFWKHLFMVPTEAVEFGLIPGNVLVAEFPISLQLIAEEIEEERDYSVKFGLETVRIANLQEENPTIEYAFSLRKKRLPPVSQRYSSP